MSAPRVVLVTGASGVVGRIVVEQFRAAGHQVIGLDREPPQRSSADVRSYVVDLADADSILDVLAKIESDGFQVDVLVNCAAVFGDYHPTHRIELATWDNFMRVNLRAPFLLIRSLLPSMVERGFGRIVNVASVSSTKGGYRQAHYAASKAGLIGLSNTVALEYGPRGITSNCVLPGVIDVPRLGDAPEDVRNHALGAIPANRWAAPSEVASAVFFLASDAAGYVNGASLPVDGGSGLLQLRFSRQIRFPGADPSS